MRASGGDRRVAVAGDGPRCAALSRVDADAQHGSTSRQHTHSDNDWTTVQRIPIHPAAAAL